MPSKAANARSPTSSDRIPSGFQFMDPPAQDAGPALMNVRQSTEKHMTGTRRALSAHRGKLMKSQSGDRIIATVHPSSVLRAPGTEARELAKRAFIADMKLVASQLRRHPRPAKLR